VAGWVSCGRESPFESAAERAAVEPRGGRVLICSTALANPTANRRWGFHKPPSKKYRPFPPVALPDRQWPNRVLTHAPRWCSVDLRDGNQALAVPMNVSQKLELFQTLVKDRLQGNRSRFPVGVEHRVHLQPPAHRGKGRAPDDVWLQVLVQAREDLIERTVESLVGAKKASSTCIIPPRPRNAASSSACRRRNQGGRRARRAQWIKDRLPRLKGTEVMLQYSPESFSATEVEFAKEISEAVMDVWQPTPEAQDDFEPAGHGRGRDAQCLCRPDRMDLPQHQKPRLAHHQFAHAQRPLHRRGGDGTWACSPARIASKARCSATANARAIWTSSPWR
jgi:hypothetical protein